MLRLLSCLLFTGCISACISAPEVRRVKADTRSGGRDLANSMFATPEEQRLKREFLLAGELSQTLEDLEGIESVRVHLSLADTSLLAKQRRTRSKASVLVRHKPSFSKDKEMLKAFVANAVGGLEPESVEVLLAEAKAEEKLVIIGPLAVAQSSAFAARVCIGGLLLLCLALAIAVIFAGIRLRRASRHNRRARNESRLLRDRCLPGSF